MHLIIKMFGQLLFIAGCFGLWYFFTQFDSSVYSRGSLRYIDGQPIHLPSFRVENAGLLSQRQNGIIISCAGLVIGSLFMLLPRPPQAE